ncbi:MAG: AbrB/MazE/SpoVT family DNA-binding domain-containing protein [Ilumatobacteraceae bacterium]
MSESYVMKVSTNGQVSIPAAARTRWSTDRVVAVDLGDRVVIRPLADDPIAASTGKYRGSGPDTATARRRARRDGAEAERRRTT